MLCNASQRGDEPAVAHLALGDVGSLDAVLIQLGADASLPLRIGEPRAIVRTGALPADLCADLVRGLHATPFADGSVVRRKLLVGELITAAAAAKAVECTARPAADGHRRGARVDAEARQEVDADGMEHGDKREEE